MYPIQLAEPATDSQRRYLCRHIHTRGNRCGSPALRGQQLCYYHTRARVEAPMAGRTGTFPMPPVDDRTAIQLALFEVLSRLSSGDIDYKRGAILLRGLQIASLNLSRPNPTEPAAPPQVESITHHHDLGDLAPIAEIPTNTPATTTAAHHSERSEDPPYSIRANPNPAPMSSEELFSGIFDLAKHPMPTKQQPQTSPSPSSSSLQPTVETNRIQEPSAQPLPPTTLNLFPADPSPTPAASPHVETPSSRAPEPSPGYAAPPSFPASHCTMIEPW
jgi:hypothetical protein